MAQSQVLPYSYSAYPRTKKEVDETDLSFIHDSWSADMLRDAMHAVVTVQSYPEFASNEVDLWKFLSTYDPPSSHGFMFSSHPITDKIIAATQVGHSGSSMAFTMRHLQFMAKYGVQGYREEYLKNTRN
jgi:hypothetical protein